VAVVALVVAASTTGARADIVPAGWKSVRLSLRVDAEVPAGQAIVLRNTMHGADVLTPGETSRVVWHPLQGPMQLMAIDARTADMVRPLADAGAQYREAVLKLTAGGRPCGAPFEGVRTVPAAAPEREIRWIYRVELSAEGCAATLVRTEKFGADGGLVSPDPEGPPDAAAAAPSAEPSSSPPPAAADTRAPSAKRGCSCAVPGDAFAGGALTWLAAALAAWMRVARRRREGGGRQPSIAANSLHPNAAGYSLHGPSHRARAAQQTHGGPWDLPSASRHAE
jgi:hypothetical protein